MWLKAVTMLADQNNLIKDRRQSGREINCNHRPMLWFSHTQMWLKVVAMLANQKILIKKNQKNSDQIINSTQNEYIQL